MNELRNHLRKGLEEAEAQRTLEEILTTLLRSSDQRLRLIVGPVLKSLEKIGQNDEVMSQEAQEGLSNLIGSIVSSIEQIGSGVMSPRSLWHLVSERRSLVSAASYLPEPFSASQQVFGALALLVRSLRIRINHDLSGQAICWRREVGEPVSCESVGELQRLYPFLVPVVFCSHVKLSSPELYRQFFGSQSGLRSLASPSKAKTKSLFELTFKRWPIQDFYALCPLPSWSADDDGQLLWFTQCTWAEQQQELVHLHRKFPGVTIRYATLPEIMFLDLSMRLATAESPFGIWSYSCEHPQSSGDCLTYGHVDDYGAEIKIDEEPGRETRVMPLFILKAEKKKGE